MQRRGKALNSSPVSAQKLSVTKKSTLWVSAGRSYFKNTCSDKGLMEEIAFQQGLVRRGKPRSHHSLASGLPWANYLHPRNNVYSVYVPKLCRPSKCLRVSLTVHSPCSCNRTAWSVGLNCSFLGPGSDYDGGSRAYILTSPSFPP